MQHLKKKKRKLQYFHLSGKQRQGLLEDQQGVICDTDISPHIDSEKWEEDYIPNYTLVFAKDKYLGLGIRQYHLDICVTCPCTLKLLGTAPNG